jgi:hypothetical protein
MACGPTNVVKPPPPGSSGHDAGLEDGGVPDGGYVSMASDPACDLGGLWATRQTNFAHGLVDTTGANWYYFEVQQVGDHVEVVDHLDCGMEIDAPGLTIVMPEKTEAIMATANSQIGRQGTMKRSGERCDFALGRFWSVRGVDKAIYLPDGPFDTRDIDDLQAAAPLPTKDDPTGAIDQDEDDHPGITLKVGNNEARYSVQRDWLEWFSCNGTAADSAKCAAGNENDFSIGADAGLAHFWTRADYNNQDFPLGATNPLYETNGTAVRDKNNRTEWTLLGRTRTDGMAAEFWGLADTKARCAMIKRLLPIERVSE